MLKWVSSGWCGTRTTFYQHFTEAQLWLQLVRDGKVSLSVFQKDELTHFQSKVLEECQFKGQAPEKRYEKH